MQSRKLRAAEIGSPDRSLQTGCNSIAFRAACGGAHVCWNALQRAVFQRVSEPRASCSPARTIGARAPRTLAPNCNSNAFVAEFVPLLRARAVMSRSKKGAAAAAAAAAAASAAASAPAVPAAAGPNEEEEDGLEADGVGGQKGVSSFISKIYRMVSDPHTQEIVSPASSRGRQEGKAHAVLRSAPRTADYLTALGWLPAGVLERARRWFCGEERICVCQPDHAHVLSSSKLFEFRAPTQLLRIS